MDKVRFAHVGCGSVSHNRYWPNYPKMPRGQLVAACDSNPARAQRAAEPFGVPWFTDLDEMLARVDFELLVNTTSTPAHYPLNLKALQAGRHVYTQKPMTITVAEADMLIEEARKRNLVIVAEDHKPIQPPFVTARALLREGLIGKICWMRCNRTHIGPHKIDNWPTDPTWFYKKGSGPLLDVGIEGLHGICSLVGPARRVTAMSGINQPVVYVHGGPNSGKRIDVEADDVTLLTLDFGDDVFAQLDTAWTVAHARIPHLEIYGAKGIMSIGGTKEEFELLLYRDEPQLGIRGWSNVDMIPPAKPWPPMRAIGVAHAFDCILDGQKPILSAELARHCIEIVNKAFVAARTGITQELETTFDPIL
jgi:predicted dehydrogenase